MLHKCVTGKHLLLILGLCFLFCSGTAFKTPVSKGLSVPKAPGYWVRSHGYNGFNAVPANKRAAQLNDVTLTYQNFFYADCWFTFGFTNETFFTTYLTTTPYEATGVLGSLPPGIYTVEIYPQYTTPAWFSVGCDPDGYAYGSGVIYLYDVEIKEDPDPSCSRVVITP